MLQPVQIGFLQKNNLSARGAKMALINSVLFGVVVLLGIWLGHVNADSDSSENQIGSPFSIFPVDYTQSHFIQPGFIHGAKDCGGKGKTLQMVNQACLHSLPGTCLFDIDKPGHPEVYFVPNEDVDEVVARVKVDAGDGVTKSFEVPIPGASLTAGQPYKLRCAGVALPEFLGKVFTGKMELLRKSDSSVQLCAEVTMLPYSNKISKVL